MLSMASAVRTGRVLFSTTILSRLATFTMLRAVASQNCRSDAAPAPRPKVLVGVFTPTKMMSHSLMAASMSVEKNRFLPRRRSTTSCRPGSKMGILLEFQASMRFLLMSTTMTLRSWLWSAITAIVGPPI